MTVAIDPVRALADATRSTLDAITSSGSCPGCSAVDAEPHDDESCHVRALQTALDAVEYQLNPPMCSSCSSPETACACDPFEGDELYDAVAIGDPLIDERR